jgi:hypothetical protein
LGQTGLKVLFRWQGSTVLAVVQQLFTAFAEAQQEGTAFAWVGVALFLQQQGK